MEGKVKRQKMVYWLIIAGGIYTILPFLLIARYNQPSADDFAGAVRDGHYTFLWVLKDSYLHWSGRYFANVVARANPLLHHSFVGYKWYAVLLLVFFSIALFVMIRECTMRYLSGLQTLSLTCLLLFLYITAMPSTAEGFYWFSGSYVYQIANIFFMLLVAGILKLNRQCSQIYKALYFFVAAVLAVCIVGSNEISLIITCSTMAFFAVFTKHPQKKRNGLLIVLLAICCVCGCIAAFAPGNFERMDAMQEYSKSPVWAFAGAAGITTVYATQWAIPMLVCTILYIPLFGNPLAKKMIALCFLVTIKSKHSIVLFILLFLLMQLFVVWVAGGSNLGRIENVVYLFLLLGWFFNVQLLVLRHHVKQKNAIVYPKPLLALVAMLFVMSVLDINNNISTAYVDLLSGKAKTYATELQDRLRLVKQCGTDTCLVPALTDLPKTIFFTDIKCTTDTLDFWMNKAYAQYTGAKYVLVDSPLPGIKTNIETIRGYGKQMRGRVFDAKQ